MKSLKLFVASVILGVCSITHAGNVVINTDGLTAADVAALKAKAAAVAASNVQTADPLKEKVADTTAVMTAAATWGQQAALAAEGFAKAIGIAARELNVEVNKFADTTVGKLVIAFIVLKVVGFKLFYFIVMTAGFIVIIKVCRSFVDRMVRSGKFTEVKVPARLNGLIPEKTIREYHHETWDGMSEGQSFFFVLGHLAQILVGVVYLSMIGAIAS